MGVSVAQFFEHLSGSGLLPEEEVRALQAALPPGNDEADSQSVAQDLVRQKKLTPYQAGALCRGKPDGLVFGNYVILRKLGQGGMGIVFQAEHRRMKRIVALKVLPPAAMKSAEAVSRFRREVEAAAKLTHPNIVAAFDADEAKGVHFFVMEYVEGRDLAQFVQEGGPVAVPEGLDYLIQAARGLEHAHERGIVHRDIKPSNLLLDSTGTVKILDLGLARFQQAVYAGEIAASSGLTASGHFMGTAAFMAPEQATDAKRADQRSDIYSLGCTLYFLLTGRLLYKCDSLMQALLAHRDDPIPPLEAVQGPVPAELDVVFRKMVAKRPEDRYQSMSEVRQALEGCQSGSPAPPRAALLRRPGESGALVAARNVANPETFTTQPPTALLRVDSAPRLPATADWSEALTPTGTSPGSRRRLWLGTAGALLLGGVAVAAVAYWNGKHDAAEPAAPQAAHQGSAPPAAPAGLPAEADVDGAIAVQKQWAEYLKIPVREVNSLEMPLVLLPPGEFDMGAPERMLSRALRRTDDDELRLRMIDAFSRESPLHRVVLTRPFLMSAHEVTVDQFAKFVKATNYGTDAELGSGGMGRLPDGWERKLRFNWERQGTFQPTGSHPVTNVSWNDAVAFCRWLSEQEHQIYRLPTEAEWEYGCRATPMGMRPTVRDEEKPETRQDASSRNEALYLVSWSQYNSEGLPHPVGQKRANAFGLYDMQGNVREWCRDSRHEYSKDRAVDPFEGTAILEKVYRNGSWNGAMFEMRPGFRRFRPAGECDAETGFRVVREIPQPADMETRP